MQSKPSLRVTPKTVTEKTPVGIKNWPYHHDESDGEAATADSAAVTVRATRYLRMNVSLGLLAIIALVAALYLGRDFIVPLLIGILASYTLSPVVEWLKSCYLPRPLGAALVLAVLVGGLTWIAFSLSDDAAAMVDKLPEATRKLRQNLVNTGTVPTTLQNMLEAAKQLEGATDDAGTKPEKRAVIVRASEHSSWLHDYALAQSALLLAVVAEAPILLLLTYFLLASGTHFRRKLVGLVGPSMTSKKDAVHILDEINVQIQRFLLTMLVSNVLVGIGVWLVFKAMGMEQAGVWGVVAGVMHSIPYLGPASVAIAAGMAAFLQFGSPLHALGIAGLVLLVAGVVGLVFMPWLQSRFAGVNAAVLFMTLLFFGWLWGAWGLLLGAPLIAITKVICDRVDSLNPIGELLGR
jgi:predicted PurR-regulated permease PerM